MSQSVFPDLDFHALAAEHDIDLAAAFAELQALYDDIDARNAVNTANLDLPCHRGCDMCCHESVFITPLEFFYVWDWAQRNLPAAERDAIIDRGIEIYGEQHETIDAMLEALPESGSREDIARRIRFRCPLLGADGACRVYPVRELLARLFGCSFSDVEGGLYACELVGAHLAGQSVKLLPARGTARRIRHLPLTGFRQVYPYYFQLYFGHMRPERPPPPRRRLPVLP